MAHVKWTICLLAIAFSAVGCARDRVATDDGPSAALGGDSSPYRLSDQKGAESRPQKRGGYEFVEPPPVPPALGVSFRNRGPNWLRTAVGGPLNIVGNGYQEIPEGQDDVQYPSPTVDSEFDQSAIAGSPTYAPQGDEYGSNVRYAPRQSNSGCGESGCGEPSSSLFDALRSRKRPSILKKLFSFGKRHDPYDQGCAAGDHCTTPYRSPGCGNEAGCATDGGKTAGIVDRRPATPSLAEELSRQPLVDSATTAANPPVLAPDGDWDNILDDLNKMRNETTAPMADEPATDDDDNPFVDRAYEENPFANTTIEEDLPTETPDFGPLEAVTPDSLTHELPLEQTFQQPVDPFPTTTPLLRNQTRRSPLTEPPVYDGVGGGVRSPEGYIEPPVWNRRTRATQKPLPPRRDSVSRRQPDAASVMKTASHRSVGSASPSTASPSTASPSTASPSTGPLKITPGNQVDYLE